jgi:hypothetical protein
MTARKGIFATLLLTAISSALYGQAPRTGRQVPPMPRIVEEGEGGWISLGVSPLGFGAAFSHQDRRFVGSLVAGLFGRGDERATGILGVTGDYVVHSGRLLAGIGGGPGVMVVSLDPRVRPFLCLNADLQLSLRFSPRLGIGVYSILGVSSQRTVGGLLICLQYGRWKF